jgi:zinc transporter, ZIP family
MDPITASVLSLSMIFAATTLGSALVFFFHKGFSEKLSNVIIGLASGIMISASFFGLLLPALQEAQADYGTYLAAMPVIGGFLIGGLFLNLLDVIVPHFHKNRNEDEGIKTEKISETAKFFLAVTIHNIPEGLAVGFACGLALQAGTQEAVGAALSLAIGIAIQNIPEGAAVSVPMLDVGYSKTKSFFFGTLSGAVEPVFGLAGLFLATSITGLMPWLLSFAAGAMFYVTIDELLPSARKGEHSHYGLWAFMIGFCIMLLLEVLL